MAAKINGRSWRAASSSIKAEANTSGLPGRLSFVGGDAESETGAVAIGAGYISGPGTYPLGVNGESVAGGGMTFLRGDGVFWATPGIAESGTLTVLSLDQHRITGTFSGRLVRAFEPSGNDTMRITDGTFAVPVNPGFTLPGGDDTGSRFSVAFGPDTWKAAGVLGLGGGSPTIDVEAATSLQIVRLHLEEVTGPGVYPLEIHTYPRRSVSVAGVKGVFGGTAEDVGSVTITELTPSRMVGTLEATLGFVAGTIQPARSITATFDVRILPPVVASIR